MFWWPWHIRIPIVNPRYINHCLISSLYLSPHLTFQEHQSVIDPSTLPASPLTLKVHQSLIDPSTLPASPPDSPVTSITDWSCHSISQPTWLSRYINHWLILSLYFPAHLTLQVHQSLIDLVTLLPCSPDFPAVSSPCYLIPWGAYRGVLPW